MTDKAQLLQSFPQVAQQDWCVLSGELAEGFGGISVPIRCSSGKLLALSIAMVQGRHTEQDLQTDDLLQLQAAAQQLEASVIDGLST